jgi:hypothetical protein
MARRKIPEDAFFLYQSLGVERSYQAVANHLGVTKRAVTKRAGKERWQERLREIEAKVRQETLEATADQQLQCLRAIQTKALQALEHLKFESARDALDALELAIHGERMILGEPSAITAVTIEHVVPGAHAPRHLKAPWQSEGTVGPRQAECGTEEDGDARGVDEEA